MRVYGLLEGVQITGFRRAEHSAVCPRGFVQLLSRGQTKLGVDRGVHLPEGSDQLLEQPVTQPSCETRMEFSIRLRKWLPQGAFRLHLLHELHQVRVCRSLQKGDRSFGHGVIERYAQLDYFPQRCNVIPRTQNTPKYQALDEWREAELAYKGSMPMSDFHDVESRKSAHCLAHA